MAATKGKKTRGEDLKQEDILQAVVIADSFNVRFAPITHRKPLALLPLVNVPLLDYTLEFLSASGVQEILVFCCAHADQIKKHISNSKWSEASSPCAVTVVVSEDCLSTGDALRDIDSRSMVRSDFILVSGDIVANIKLNQIMEEHRKRREKEKSVVMTLVYKRAPPGQHSRCKEDDFVTAVESKTNQVLHYQKTQHQKHVHIPREVFTERSDVEIHYDFLDTHISICSPLVPQLFTDNFDYQTREDFIRGILINEEILGNTIHVHTLTDEYASRISNVQMYDAVSRDIMNRWIYPLVPDVNISSRSRDRVSYGRHNIYRSQDVTLARGCILEENVVIGAGTSVGSNTTISHSVVGRNCSIGENVSIEGAYIWDGVNIEDNCTVKTAIICDEVTLYEGVTIEPGCVLSWKVRVGPNVTLDQGTSLTSEPVEEEDDWGDDDDEDKNTKTEVTKQLHDKFGVNGQAYLFKAPCDSDDEDEEFVQDIWGLTVQSSSSEEGSSEESDSDEALSPSASPPPDDAKLFYSEVLDTMSRAKEENISTDNTILEINSLKHAYNINIRDVIMLVTKALVEFPQLDTKTHDSSQLLQLVLSHLSKQLSLIKNYIKSPDSQRDCLLALEDLSTSKPSVGAILMKIIHLLYEQDILLEQVIIRWYDDVPESEEKADKMAVRKLVAPLIKWLQEADEESEEESDDQQ